MSTVCPQCRSEFPESAGFCPFDGAPLVIQASAPGGAVGAGAGDEEYVSLRDMPSTTAAMRALGADALAEVSPYQALVGITLDGRYVVQDLLGEGGAGVVFRGYHALIHKPVAIKVLKPQAAADPSVVARFVQEARAASRIGHPSIVDITDFGQTPDGLPYSVMELIDGPTLEQVIQERAPMAPARALPIAAHIAHALAAAHEKGIVHRDLKPENVFVVRREDGRDEVKIVDFGIAKIVPLDGRTGPKLTVAGTVFGTPEYMAPEQAAGREDIDHRVDVYALGAILYQLLCARLPHQGEDMMRTLAMKLLDPVLPMSAVRPDLELDEALDRAVLRALERKPEDRFAGMAEFLSALERAAGAPLLGDSSAASSSSSLARAPGPVTALEARATDELVDGMPTAPFLGQGAAVAPVVAGAHASRPRRRAGLWLAVAVVGLTASAAVGFAVVRGSNAGAGASAPTRDPGEPGAPGEPITATPASAPPVALAGASMPGAPQAAETGLSETPAAPSNVTEHQAHTGKKGARGDAGATATPDTTAAAATPGPAPVARDKLSVKILTQPENARLYVDQNYSGKGGTTIERERGTEITVECRSSGYKTGRVTVRFDGETEVYLCPLARTSKCVDGIKNPFDDC